VNVYVVLRFVGVYDSDLSLSVVLVLRPSPDLMVLMPEDNGVINIKGEIKCDKCSR
jgi:hypothetical protein